jgi:CelD/BcsL family acetyltransferase involved in cellulose biosynthesis
MRLEAFTDVSIFHALRPEWNELLNDSAADTLFLTWEWQTTWWERLGEGTLLVLVAREDDGRLVGIAPLYSADGPGPRALSFVGCVDVSDYLDFIVRRRCEAAVFPLFMDSLAGYTARWDTLDLCNIPAGSPTLDFVPGLARARGWSTEVAVEDVCPVIRLPATWDDYLASLGKHQRHEVRRKLRKIDEEAQVEHQRVTGGPNLADALEEFLHLHRLSQPDKDRFMDERMAAFFRAITATLSTHDELEVDLLRLDGQPAAAMLNFRYGDRLLVYNSGYDPGLRPNLSSGIALLSLCIRSAIERGVADFDFLQGNEEYKYRFGASDTAVHRLRVTR